MKLKLTWLLTLFMAFVMQFSFAQEKMVTGTVTTESDGLPLPGASVIVKGTTKGAQTDFDGKYSISVNIGDVLEISYVGMEPAQITIGAANVYDVSLKEGNALEEVVVVAYGVQKKEAITGAVATLSSETIGSQQVTSPLGALQGTVAGVNVVQSGGQPGTNPSIRIRGFSSLNNEQGPLYIVDGVPFNGNINTISQDQIESFTVLKDATSAGLYGARGANGVIIITTKKGSLDTGMQVSVRTQYGISNPSVGLHDLVDSQQHMELAWLALKNNNQYGLGQPEATAALNATNDLIPTLGYNPYGVTNPIGTDGNLIDGASLLWNEDWQSAVIRRDAQRVNHNLSISGGSSKSSYFFSFDYLNEEGPVITSDFERLATRLNVESQVKEWLKVGVNTSYSRSLSGNPDQTSGSTTQAITWIYNTAPIYPIYRRDANGALLLDSNGNRLFDAGNNNTQPVNGVRPGITGENLLASLILGDETRIRSNFIGNGYAEVSFLKNFKFRSTLAFETYLFDSHSFDDDEIGAAANVNGRVSKQRSLTNTLTAIQALNYTKSFGKHNLSVDAIMEAYETNSDTFSASVTGFLPGQEEFGNGTNPENTSGFRLSERINGYLARVAYNYDNKYFVDGFVRRDGLSRFNDGFRWGTFYGFGVNYVISNEDFMQNVDWVNNLKVRATYGELGNSTVLAGGANDFFPAIIGFDTFNPNENNPSILPPAFLPDPELSWETTATTNFGVDFSLFDSRLRGSVDYFKKESVDLIFSIPAASSTGIQSLLSNAGTVENRGWEFAINYDLFRTDNFDWSIGANFDMIENEITELVVDESVQGSFLWKEGLSRYDFYMPEWAGVDPATGDALWYQDITDVDGNVTGRAVTNQYDQATQYETGKSAIPDVQGGFNTNLRFKQFDLRMLFNFSFGGYLYDSDYAGLIGGSSLEAAFHEDNLQSWKQPGDITDIPRFTTENNNFTSRSTRFLFKNDYVRLRALTLGYNFSQEALDKTGLSSLRIYIQGDNLVVFQARDGIDPEQAFNGITGRRSPLPSTISTGIQVQF